MILFENAVQLRLFLISKGAQSYGLDVALTDHFMKEASCMGSVELKDFLKNRFAEFNSKEQLKWVDNDGRQIEIRTRMVDITIKEETDESNYEYETMFALDCNSFEGQYFSYI